MDSKEMGELLSRIDERTEFMSLRQAEELKHREILTGRVESLEGWRNILAGAYGAVMTGLGAIGLYIKSGHK